MAAGEQVRLPTTVVLETWLRESGVRHLKDFFDKLS
jgi:hypothetical protein